MNAEAPPTPADQAAKKALVVGIVGLAALGVGAILDKTQFFRSYLLAFLFFLGLPLGSLALQLLHNLTGGGWGFAIKPVLRAGTRTLWLMVALFTPLCFGVHDLYEWSHADVVAADPVLQHKSPYLNTPFFLARSIFYLVMWVALAWWTGRIWRNYADRAETALGRRLRKVSAPALAMYCLTMSFAAVDWGMSLEPHWFSTIYGMHFIVGQALSVMCLSIIMLHFLMRRPDFARLVKEKQLHDLGNLLFAFVMLWAYVSFSQYLIIWSGNLPEETPWYLHRTAHGWQAVSLLLVLFHFAVPFLLLLSRKNKRHGERLWKIAAFLLALRFVDLVWVVVPAFHPHGFFLHWMDGAAAVGMGGLWAWNFRRQMRHTRAPLEDKGQLRTGYAELKTS